ncbi:MAG: alpha/beta hydrolase [Leucobacter sp.]
MNEPGRPVDAVIAAMRENPLDFAGDIPELRERFEALGVRPDAAIHPFAESSIDGVPVLELVGDEQRGTVLFVHAGGYVAGSAAGSFGLAAALARESGRRVLSVDYSLAPEHPYPVARDEIVRVYEQLLCDGIDPRALSFVGASAGGGLVLQALQHLRDTGRPLPGAAALLSPFLDLTLSGQSYGWNADRDPSLTARGLAAAAAHYAPSSADRGALRPTPDSLRDLPPTQVHVGSIEILLSDSTDFAAAAAAADVRVELEVWPGMVHVFPTFAALLPEGVEALRRVGAFLDRWSSRPQTIETVVRA